MPRPGPMTKAVAYSPNLWPTAYGSEPELVPGLSFSFSFSFSLGSNQAQSLGLYMVIWCEPGPWPFQRPLPLGLGPWFLGFEP